MIFCYWSGPPGSESAEPEAVAAWKARLPSFRMFDDRDVLPILAAYDSNLPQLFERIRIPACKSDLARLLLLYEYGGLYVDAHVGPEDGFALADTLDFLSSHELVLFCDKHCDPSVDLKIMNTVIAGRKHADALLDLIDGAVANLRAHERKEASTDSYVAYNIFVLTGAWDISIRIFDRSRVGNPMREQYQGRVCLAVPHEHPTARPYRLYAHYGYRAPGSHWSERQKHQRLFERAPAAGSQNREPAIATARGSLMWGSGRA
jgi:Glycosyltransferase sugar-binding region containing DXD motif